MTLEEGRPEAPVQHITSPLRWVGFGFRDIVVFRELLYFLTLRDIKVRYNQTVLGIAWALLQPLFSMLIFSLIFLRWAGLHSPGRFDSLTILTALVPWQLFSYALTQSSNRLLDDAGLIRKVYFPRILIPISSVLAGLFDFAFALLLLLLFLIVSGITPSWRIILVPLMVAMTLASALGVGLWLSALNARFRDVKYTVPFLNQVWFFLTPIVYPDSLIPEAWKPIWNLNPMTGVVNGFRWAFLGNPFDMTPYFLTSVLVTVLLLLSGWLFFRGMELSFSDWL